MVLVEFFDKTELTFEASDALQSEQVHGRPNPHHALCHHLPCWGKYRNRFWIDAHPVKQTSRSHSRSHAVTPSFVQSCAIVSQRRRNSAAFEFDPISAARVLRPACMCLCVCVCLHSVGNHFSPNEDTPCWVAWKNFLARLPSRLLAGAHSWRHNLICWLPSSSLPHFVSRQSCPTSLRALPHNMHTTKTQIWRNSDAERNL